MTEPTEWVISYGRALTQALKAFDMLEPKARWFERLLIRLLRATYRDRLRYLVETLPADIADEILGVNER